MNDRAVTALGKIYREDLNAKEVWELYAENMFPGKKHAIISPVFKADSNLSPSSVPAHWGRMLRVMFEMEAGRRRSPAVNCTSVPVDTKEVAWQDTRALFAGYAGARA